MARYSHLPIYKLSYSLARDIFSLQEKLPKNLKHTLGQKLFDTCVSCVDNIIIANSAEEKLPHLKSIGLLIERSWTFLRMLYDFKGITQGEFKAVSERLNEITKQLLAWMKWEKERLRREKTENK